MGGWRWRGMIASVAGIGVIAGLAQAAEVPPDTETTTLPTVDVVAEQLNRARDEIQPSLGASTYSFSPEALQTLPQGDNAPLNQVLLQAPGVVQDSFGQIHVRGDHANVQYRLNGVELPEGLSVFGQVLESRFAHSLELITGALPAQYGFQTAGVVDIQTKTGLTDPGLTISAYGGSFDWLQPSFSYGGQSGPVDYFVTGDYLHNDRGIENPAATYDALHDTTNQFHGLAFVEGIIDPQTRLSLILGGVNSQFQVPNNPGQVPTLGLNVYGVMTANSATLNENQREITDFAILSLQKHLDAIDVQMSLFGRYSSLDFSPDPLGDLLFNGIAQQARREDDAGGIQADRAWRINDKHTLRAGFLAQDERSSYKTASQVLATDAAGAQLSNVPLSIYDGGGRTGWLYGLYVQDEWRLLPTFTVNYGVRLDAVDQYTHEGQISPRLNVVWTPSDTTTLHAGYSRYFVPPPFELVSDATIGLFANTTAAPAVTEDSTVKAERSNYFDVGVTHTFIKGLTFGLDGYFKQATNLIDEGQFGAPIILTAFNYRQGEVKGLELTGSYDHGPWSLYGNLAYSRAIGKGIDSAQFNFAPEELSYIAAHWVHLDHDQRWTGSGGIAYSVWRASDHPLRLSADLIVESGLRASTAQVPNGIALPCYGAVNLSAVQKIALGLSFPTELRLDVLNAGDTVYQVRNGTGIGVGAPQYGLRRAVLAGITQRF
ncbi:TonB-dependent receptor [Acidisphaera rubrifaciens]|uniref:TonB-dependent outer membrane colicin I receptor n=1 Tax=Acidisphaera rubrifaciens HS-AP3 TaxID=1231350 RepID=A0A0D6PA90_9PROT|nr:TonB-dependent receptor [Acidisphaera rubrifaciens]GAN78108.1 TonB-dependent outer membrane colicin I receptor [Acidisphaera rubrifaciens HS-AP3]